MKKKLSEMNLEELWQLFPIYLQEYRPCWKDWYAQETAFLKGVLIQAERISHIGSTAVGFIWAKPIVDILVEIPQGSDLGDFKALLTSNGYTCMWQGEDQISFNKGYTEDGFAEKVFHLHLRYRGDNDELYFRDYLIDHPDAAQEYQEMKLKLWKEYEHDRDGYTNAKTGFIKSHTEKAKTEYGKRYK